MNSQGYRPQQGSVPASQWYAPAPQQQTAQGQKQRAQKRSGGKQPPKRPKRSLKGQLIKLLLLVIVAGVAYCGLLYWKTQSELTPYANVFLPRVSVDGIDLSGKTWEEGSRLVWEHVWAKEQGWHVTLRNAWGQSNDITASMLGISFDPTSALAQAWSVGHQLHGDVFSQKQQLDVALAGEYSFSSAESSADTSAVDSILATLENAAYRAPTNAMLLSFDPDNTTEPFTYQQEVYGQRLKTEEIRSQILYYVHNLENGEVFLETEVIEPSVTVEELSKNVELRTRAVTPISKSSTADRTSNIRTAFAKINGTVLENGQTFSFNKTVGDRSLKNGFLPAVEYIYGAESLGVGGGVCQASTTVYLAAMQAKMKVIKREPHSMKVNYTELGLDATVSDTKGHEIDLTFKNDSGAPVYITAHVITSPSNKKNLLCEVRIYGLSLNGVSYEMVSQTVQTIEKPVEAIMVEDKKQTYVTYTDETKTIKGREGYVVDAYLVCYQGGSEVSREKVSTDYYKEKADTVYYGTQLRGDI